MPSPTAGAPSAPRAGPAALPCPPSLLGRPARCWRSHPLGQESRHLLKHRVAAWFHLPAMSLEPRYQHGAVLTTVEVGHCSVSHLSSAPPVPSFRLLHVLLPLIF